MCGICGMYFKKGEGDSKAAVIQMTKALAHRGPDAEGHYFHPKIGFGHRRLSIIDLDDSANQPFHSQNGRYHLVFNGEIYNYQSIRRELRQEQKFLTQSDTEVVLAAFMKWGPACLERLEGMFAFAIWDQQKEKLFIARDRLGIKPLYYYQNEDSFIFSSEIRSLIKSNSFTPRIDRNSVFDFLSYQTVHAPHTILENVFSLMPGHYLEWQGTEVIESKWWDPNRLEINSNARTKEDWSRDIRESFLNAVEKRMVADVPFGAFLSGGIDSSAIVAAMAEISQTPISTFSVVFEEKQFSEESYSSLVASKYQTNHHKILLRPDDFLGNIPSALKAMDHPSGDGINTYTVSKATKNAGITMALSGLGGDELFAGYPVFSQIPKINKLKMLPYFLRAGMSNILGSDGAIKRQKAAGILAQKKLNLNAIYPEMRRLIGVKHLEPLMKGLKDPERLKHMTTKITEAAKHHPLLSQISLLEIQSYMQNVLLRDADQFSMAHALEVRVPFLDHKLVELMLKVPDRFKQGAFPKELLVESLGDRIPPPVYQRNKMGFVFPWESWLKHELKTEVLKEIDEIKELEFLNAAEIERICGEFYDGNGGSWLNVWNFSLLNKWMKENGVES